MFKKWMSMVLCLLLIFPMVPAAQAEAEKEKVPQVGIALAYPDAFGETVYPTYSAVEIISRDPYVAALLMVYFVMPREEFSALQKKASQLSEEEHAYISTMQMMPGFALVTESSLPETLGMIGMANREAVELGSAEGFHFYYVSVPEDHFLNTLREKRPDLTDAEAADMRSTIQADLEMARRAFLQTLEDADYFAPTTGNEPVTGRTVRFETLDLYGKTVTSEELFAANRITMVNVWGTWCPWCMQEMEELAQIHAWLQENGCGVLGLDYEQETGEAINEMVRSTLEQFGAAYPNVIYPLNAAGLEVTGYPTTFFVDSEGRMMAEPVVGANVEAYRQTMERLLEEIKE